MTLRLFAESEATKRSFSELIEDSARESDVGIRTGENHELGFESPPLLDVVTKAATDVEIQIR